MKIEESINKCVRGCGEISRFEGLAKFISDLVSSYTALDTRANHPEP